MSEPIDIIIPVRITGQFGNSADLDACLSTLNQTTRNFRLILVDDNSDEAGAAIVDQAARMFPNSLLIRTHFQRWWTRAINLGLRMARTQRVVTLNSDTVLGAGWLDELLEVWSQAEQATGKRVGLVGSVYSPEETRRWHIASGQDYVTGHCWLVSIPALGEASAERGMPGIYLDERRQDAIHIRSDVFICWQLSKLGWLSVKSFKSAVGHVGGKSWGHRLGDVNSLSLEQVSERWT